MMNEKEQMVSTEAQRLALEAMSAQLVHKLNAMIAEQESRTRAFAEKHHTSIELPQVPRPAEPPPTASEISRVLPKPPEARRLSDTRQTTPWASIEHHDSAAEEKPLRVGPKKQSASAEEENNIGLGMIIFSLVSIVILLRSCT